MRSSHDQYTHILEVCSTKDHYYRMAYKSADKAQMAALGFHRAMRDSPPDATAALWQEGIVLVEDVGGEMTCGGMRVPMFSIRVGEIGSVCLRECTIYNGNEGQEEGEAWA